MESAELLTTTGLLAAAQNALLSAGYRWVDEAQNRIESQARALQNQYSVVMVYAFETWEELAKSWPDCQSATVETMSTFLTRGESKAADGYLVLLTASRVPLDEISEANRIRTDMSRLRKLLGTGDEIHTISDVRRVIAPLLPLSVDAIEQPGEGSLEALPRILERHQIDATVTTVVVEAFKANLPIMQRLHELEHPK